MTFLGLCFLLGIIPFVCVPAVLAGVTLNGVDLTPSALGICTSCPIFLDVNNLNLLFLSLGTDAIDSRLIRHSRICHSRNTIFGSITNIGSAVTLIGLLTIPVSLTAVTLGST